MNTLISKRPLVFPHLRTLILTAAMIVAIVSLSPILGGFGSVLVYLSNLYEGDLMHGYDDRNGLFYIRRYHLSGLVLENAAVIIYTALVFRHNMTTIFHLLIFIIGSICLFIHPLYVIIKDDTKKNPMINMLYKYFTKDLEDIKNAAEEFEANRTDDESKSLEILKETKQETVKDTRPSTKKLMKKFLKEDSDIIDKTMDTYNKLYLKDTGLRKDYEIYTFRDPDVHYAQNKIPVSKKQFYDDLMDLYYIYRIERKTKKDEEVKRFESVRKEIKKETMKLDE